MSRVERTVNPSERRGSEQLRRARRGPSGEEPPREPSPGHTPTKAEGEVGDVEEALDRQKE
jgi:hypothetical protein